MKKSHIIFWAIIGLFLCEGLMAKVEESEFDYTVDGTTYKGFIADGSNGKKVPGVIVVHEWWGHNEYPKERARMLAKQGYVAFAIDMFGNGKIASHPKEAGKFASESMKDPKAAKKVFDKTISILKERDDVAKNKIAAIGYCYGGSVVLNMAAMGSDLDLVASFHGGLSEDFSFNKRKDQPKVLIFNGDADPMVQDAQIKHVKKELKNKGVDYEFKNYKGAKHAFTNPIATKNGKKFGIPLEYNKEADEDSWEKLVFELKKL